MRSDVARSSASVLRSVAISGRTKVAPPKSTANRSSVITPSRIRFSKSNRTPARSVLKFIGSPRLATGTAGSNQVSQRQTAVQTALKISAATMLHRAMIAAPSTGPVIEAISNRLLFQATALLKIDFGMICGRIACRAGRAKVSAIALTSTIPNISHRYCF